MNHMSKKHRKKLYCVIFVLFQAARLMFYGDFDFPRMIKYGELPDAGICLHVLIIVFFAAVQAISYLCFEKKRSAGILAVFSLIACNPEIIGYSTSPVKLFSLILFFVYLILAAADRKYINLITAAFFLTVTVMLVPSNIFSVALMIIEVYFLSASERIKPPAFAVFAFCAGSAFIANRLLLKLGVPYWIMSAGDLSFGVNLHSGIINIIRYLLLLLVSGVLVYFAAVAVREYKDCREQNQLPRRSPSGKKKNKEKTADQQLSPFRKKIIIILTVSAGFVISVFGELFTSCSSTAFMFILVSLLVLPEDSDTDIGNALLKADTFFKNHLFIWMALLCFTAFMHSGSGGENTFHSTVTHFFFG